MTQLVNFTEILSLAFHAMAKFATAGSYVPASTKSISEELGADEPIVSRTLQRLMRAGLLQSSKGPGGGYMLSRPAEEINLMDIVMAVEGTVRPKNCGMKNCDTSCPVGVMCDGFSKSIEDTLSANNVIDLANWFKDGCVPTVKIDVEWTPKG